VALTSAGIESKGLCSLPSDSPVAVGREHKEMPGNAIRTSVAQARPGNKACKHSVETSSDRDESGQIDVSN